VDGLSRGYSRVEFWSAMHVKFMVKTLSEFEFWSAMHVKFMVKTLSEYVNLIKPSMYLSQHFKCCEAIVDPLINDLLFLSLAQEFFTYMEKSPLPVIGCKI
jgi:hypothetical protein